MYLHAGSVDETARYVTQPEFITACQQRFTRSFGTPPSVEEVRSWRRSWPALLTALCSARLAGLHVLLEYSLPATGERIDALVIGRSPDGRLCAVVIELKQWTHARTDSARCGLIGIGDRTVQHPARQVGGYARYLQDWVSSDELELRVRGVAVLHDAPADLVKKLRELSAHGPSADFPVLGRDDLDTGTAPKLLAERLACTDLQPPAPEDVTAFLATEHQPSPGLLARAGRVIEGNDALALVGDQDLARQEVWHAVTDAQRRGRKSTIVVTGGPGTGKTVIACRLLGDLCSRHKANPRLLSPSGTLTRQLKRTVGDESRGLITTFLDKVPTSVTSNSVILLDEAHRARTYPDHQRNKFPTTLGKLMDRAAVSVLFLDERQIVRPTEGITLAQLAQHAHDNDRTFRHIDLTAQFRCNGSTAYHQWIDQLLQPHGTVSPWTGADYDLAIASDPEQFTEWVERHQSTGHTARIAAGFCWPWDSPPTPPLRREVRIAFDSPEGRRVWERPWNSRADETGLDSADVPARPFWATDKGGHDQVGCIYTAQGMEYAYNVVIIGHDLIRHNGRWEARPQASHDPALKQLPPPRYLQYALNSYRVLSTRGTKGTRLYSTDRATQSYLEEVLPLHSL